jgi:hypothetical protein
MRAGMSFAGSALCRARTYDTVGSTTSHLKALGGNTDRIDTGLEVTGPKYVVFPSIANRMQFMTGTRSG